MTADEHLSLEQVRAYVRGALHPSTLVATDDHLEGCAACRATLARESDASFGAEAFGRALASAEARAESPHLAFEHLRGAVEGTLTGVDQAWVNAHVRLCPLCGEELRDLERFSATLPARPQPAAAATSAHVPAASSHATLGSPYEATGRHAERPRAAPPRETPDEDPPARYGETAPARLPLWLKVAAGLSLLAIVQLWAC